jgi:formylmethanofuran dehydrogenase subunit E
MEDDKIFCAICGEDITDSEYEEVNGQFYCMSCLEDNFEKCDDCGEWVEAGTLTEVSNGDEVCENCLENDYSYCDDCEEYYPNEDMTYISSYDRTVCDDCLQHYYTCNSCGEYVHEDDARMSEIEDEPYCEDCYWDRFSTCEDCGREFYQGDGYYCDDDGCYYCEDCIGDHESSYHSGSIYEYHARSVQYIPKYHDDVDRVRNEKNLYGLELEIGGDEEYADDFQDIMGDKVVLMHDGSVDGFEMVSMPVTREYFYKDFIPTLEKGLKYLSKNGCIGHNAGGIHVHFKKLDNGMQVANMARIMYGDDKDKKIWLKITQRKQHNMHWCSMNTNIYPFEKIINDNIMYPSGSSDFHGTALNYDTRTCTHELRIFNSNLRLERVLKNMECVFALEDYVRRASDLVCDTRGFITFVDEHATDYPHLADFMHEKKIFEIANKFYGDEYSSEPNNVDLLKEIANSTLEDGSDTDTSVDEEIRELLQATA